MCDFKVMHLMRRRIPSPYQNTDKTADAGIPIIQNYKKKDMRERQNNKTGGSWGPNIIKEAKPGLCAFGVLWKRSELPYFTSHWWFFLVFVKVKS